MFKPWRPHRETPHPEIRFNELNEYKLQWNSPVVRVQLCSIVCVFYIQYIRFKLIHHNYRGRENNEFSAKAKEFSTKVKEFSAKVKNFNAKVKVQGLGFREASSRAAPDILALQLSKISTNNLNTTNNTSNNNTNTNNNTTTTTTPTTTPTPTPTPTPTSTTTSTTTSTSTTASTSASTITNNKHIS